MRKEEGIIAVLIIGLALLFTFAFNIQFTGLVVFDQSTQTDFDEGVYSNVEYAGGAVALSLNNTSGTYTSKIFNASEEVNWDNLTWAGNVSMTTTNSLSSATHTSDVTSQLSSKEGTFYSADLTSTSLQLNFTGNLVSGATLELHAKMNGTNESVNVKDSSGNLLGSFMVTSSTGEDLSVPLNLTSPTDSVLLEGDNSSTVDFDYASALNPSGVSLDFQVRACSDENCSSSNFTTPSDLNSLGLTGQYFQYQASFAGTSASPTLESVSVSNSIIPLSITLLEPKGTKTPDSINLIFIVEGGVPESCQYSIEDDDNNIVKDNTTITDCGNTTFSLSNQGEGSYSLDLYVDSTDKGMAFETSSFTVVEGGSSESSSEESNQEQPSNVQSPVVGVTPTTQTPAKELTASDLEAVSSNSGSTESIQWTVSNTGKDPLSACAVKPLGDLASWIAASEDTLNINSGEQGTFLFDVAVPEGTVEGSYTLSVSLECAETATTKDFSFEVLSLEPETAEASETAGTGTGFAIFEGIGAGSIIIVVVLVGGLVALLVVTRRMRKSGKTLRSVFSSFKAKFHHSE